MKYTPAKHDLVTIWDSGQLANSKGERTQGHKSIPLNDITELKVGGATLRVSPNA